MQVRLGAHLTVHDPDSLTVSRLVAQFAISAAAFAALDGAHLLMALGSSSSGSGGGGAGTALAMWAAALSPRQALLLAGSALASGTGAAWLQGRGQRELRAAEAQLLFSLTPLFGALWAFAALGEPATWHEAAGGAGLVLGAFATLRAAD